jgi:hypothetical protein
MTTLESSFNAMTSFFRKVGPYLLLELLLPGGTIVALILFLCQRGQPIDPIAALRAGLVARALSACLDGVRFVTCGIGIAWAWRGRERERDGLEALAMAPM